jgi:hypothetical protein
MPDHRHGGYNWREPGREPGKAAVEVARRQIGDRHRALAINTIGGLLIENSKLRTFANFSGEENGGSDGTRTRDLRRDRPAL